MCHFDAKFKYISADFFMTKEFGAKYSPFPSMSTWAAS